MATQRVLLRPNIEVRDDILETQGAGVTFNLTYTPIIGMVSLYRGGLRIHVTSAYTVAGKVVTLLVPLMAGETLRADYYRA